MSESSAKRPKLANQKADNSDENLSVLSPFAGLPTQNVLPHATVLLVGDIGVGKRTFAQMLIDSSENLAVQIRTSGTLPLPPPKNNTPRPRIDFVVFMMDLTNRQSFHTIRHAASQVDLEFFFGRSCILATRAEKISSYAVETYDIEQMAELYDIPLVFANLLNHSNSKTAVNRALRLIETAAGYKQNVTPLFLQSTIHYLLDT